MEHIVGFVAGASYGFTSVVVGQPLDTVKTRMQAGDAKALRGNMVSVGRELLVREGITGLYRGGLPLFIGGTLFRSAQFGVNDIALKGIRSTRSNSMEPIAAESRIFGILDYEVIFAGFCGGIGRGLVEAPFEFIKVRRQVEKSWKLRDIYKGSSVTIFRNAFLFMSFMTYIDFGNQLVPGGLTPFMKGAICANLAWLTVWPLDVVKSQIQSGNFKNQNMFSLLRQLHQTGKLYRGLLPGLARSSIANGCSMEVYTRVQAMMNKQLQK
mmetsp:Transcript_6593/g.7987  ORF Transcript_6593/g.7987 Transcript_6593/m.7987 type:complete len:268 (+) Transcript_6593:130-933(+)|eukprot:CAMPEP_0184022570 /NCGR_PEP_ID=MMETSP0954-20121128/10704_1 /TAXON_ID=627963 /ORGANISM="Aplanochytrium sp, Strain PBS07" /LENGTH=267 /DNA_ID=CAMNT_0026305009 /DNA_START=109 /DNA_END=912 /DNA_ORIENTATION=+